MGKSGRGRSPAVELVNLPGEADRAAFGQLVEHRLEARPQAELVQVRRAQIAEEE